MEDEITLMRFYKTATRSVLLVEIFYMWNLSYLSIKTSSWLVLTRRSRGFQSKFSTMIPCRCLFLHINDGNDFVVVWLKFLRGNTSHSESHSTSSFYYTTERIAHIHAPFAIDDKILKIWKAFVSISDEVSGVERVPNFDLVMWLPKCLD